MHKKPLSSRYPHTLQLASELGKPVVFISLAEGGGGSPGESAGICEYAVIVIGPFEYPYAVDGFVNPQQKMSHEQLLAVGMTARNITAHPTWDELWQGGLGNVVTNSLIVGSPGVERLLTLLDTQAVRYQLPSPRWDWLDVRDLFVRASGRDWQGDLPALAAELEVRMPGLARPLVGEPVLLARLFEAILSLHGTDAVGDCRHVQAPPLPRTVPVVEDDPFALTPPPAPTPGRTAPELRLVPPAISLATPPAETDPFDIGAGDGDTIPAMTPFYGGSFTLQELCDAMLDRLVEQGLVKTHADVIGALRGLGLIIEKSKDAYAGVVVDTAIRAKRRLRGRYYRPNFAAAPEEEPATAPAVEAAARGDLMERLEQQIAHGGYQSLEHQLRLIEADFPQSTRQTLTYAISMLLDKERLGHEAVADEAVQNWLVDAVSPLVRRDGSPILLKPIMATLLANPVFTKAQILRLDYVQLRVALHRLGIIYPAKKRTV